MQDRYAGDIGDYIKLSLLRRISEDSRLTILWWLHPDETHNGDGRHTTYLDQPTIWRTVDPLLFDSLHGVVRGGSRGVAALESIELFPHTNFNRIPVPIGRERHSERAEWFEQQVRSAQDADVVFIDPDNGIDHSANADRAASAKHITISELRRLASLGASLVVYHHQTRRAGGHAKEISHISEQLIGGTILRVSAIRARRFSPRVYFLINANDRLERRAREFVAQHPHALEWFEGFETLSDSERQLESAPFAATVLTLYPAMFPGPLGHSMAGRALDEGRWSLDAINVRDFATDRHRTVDDTPAGGGAGMVLRADVVAAALDSVADNRPILAMTPRGVPLTQARVRDLAMGEGAIILCGRFEGFDERLFEARAIEEVSIGDYVLSGGETAALVLLDACVRLLPGVMGSASSGDEESFESGLLEYPHYTRPQEWEGRTIPEVLRSGDHAAISAWRKSQAERDTRLRRPDLWERHVGARVGRPLARGDE